LGPFRLLQQIAAGSLGPVFRAYDQQHDRLLAVKWFTLDLPPDRLRQLVAEFERLITADLGHPGIAAPVTTGIAGGSVYLAHEFMEGEPFDLAVRQYGPAPANEARRIATQLAGALDSAAAVDIVHGALHPRDVMLLGDETRVTGLGIARALEQVGISIPVRRPYTAPERVRGAAWDRRADVYTLAALLHELLWGRRITGTGAELAATAVTDVAGGDLTALRQAFSRALADRPEDRFATALEFAEAVDNAFTPAAVEGSRRPPVNDPLDRREAAAVSTPVAPAGKLRPDRVDTSSADTARHRDLDLGVAKQSRYADAEVGPAVVREPLLDVPLAAAKPPDEKLALIPVTLKPGPVPAALRVPESAKSRSMWPLVLVLVLGLGLGAAIGYGLKMPARPDPQGSIPDVPSQAAQVPPPTAPASPAPTGRDFTESAVPEPPKAATPTGTENRPKPEPAVPAAVEGRLLVRSEPAGATVLVDGRDYGTTPAVVRGLGRGTHRVRLVRDGYLPEERSVAITSARPAPSLVVVLEPRRPAAQPASQSIPGAAPGIERYTGSLVVESLPPGATVYLDNRAVGRTPLTLNRVNAGEHVVRLERDGYGRWSRSIRVVASERNRVTASLER
jgi:eukaryotic-like serine/threonine-protein kinase